MIEPATTTTYWMLASKRGKTVIDKEHFGYAITVSFCCLKLNANLEQMNIFGGF